MTMTDRSEVASAREARKRAYAPHSGHKVGAVIVTETGREYPGANVEICGRSTSTHAEMMAAFSAVLAGDMDWSLLACTETPCAMCAHTLAEWADDDFTIVTPDGTHRLGDFLGISYRPGDHDE